MVVQIRMRLVGRIPDFTVYIDAISKELYGQGTVRKEPLRDQDDF
ncbi:hypothetical protein [Maribacter sp. 2307ULW6-5]